MNEKRWPVSDRDVKPWWYHALNWTCAALAMCCAVVLLLWLGVEVAKLLT
ncbi:hypothetical protein [Mycobacterium intracellulare]|nr:hypothetical protein [Mycobacterium intracellulare]